MLLNPNIKLVLASKSPRRQELIKQLSENVEIRIQDVDEIYGEEIEAAKVPEYLAKLKAEALKNTLIENEILIASDTIVLLENKILGKPKSIEEAKQMLQNLSAKKHTVISACCLVSTTKEKTFSCHTEVYFKELLEEEINYYVDKFKPTDKAGSYGIQEWIGMIGIEKIDGCYYNVMGLPLSRLNSELKEFMCR